MTQDTPLSRLGIFLGSYTAKAYRKGEIILFQGEAPRSAYIIKSGIVKAYNLSTAGDEKPIAFYSEMSLFPAAWVFGKVPSAIYYYEALTDVEVYHFPREDYLALIQRDTAMLFWELERYVADDVGKTMRLNALQHSRASDKLVYTLHYLALSHGKAVKPNVMEITISLTHQDFANLTGLTRETTATELNKLKSKGVISYGKHEPYRIDIQKLNAALNDQFIADLEVLL
jgi:CRP/FNR family cyclic AMP-dependent transcriptional regulator